MLILGIAAFLSLNFSSCLQNEPTIGIIKVIDTNAVPVKEAKVRVFCSEPLCTTSDSDWTNDAGKTHHKFELPAVLRVYATKTYYWDLEDAIIGNDTLDTLIVRVFSGEGFLSLEEHETVEKDIVISGKVPNYPIDD